MEPAQAAQEHRMPRWVKVLAVGGFIVGAALLLAMVLSGGDHGPGRHVPALGGGLPWL